ncbi:hypothetical protein CCMA1212_008529 [Trichoderma ghanense]|uniref:Ricin B lectin domain-containing protein n=1 Tax=Trichoderma ghanense TaxID=65468 RepID=A0ABY2GW88_9HYPO
MTDKTDDSSTTCTQYTPETSEPTIVGEPWDGRRYAVPWPGNKYHIFINDTDRAICSNESGGVYVHDINSDVHKQFTWLCVEKNGYFGFVNMATGRFIGHNNQDLLRSEALNHEAWELMTVRKHPKGGYELLMPHWWHTLKRVSVVAGSDDLVLRQHGTTLWQFVMAD